MSGIRFKIEHQQSVFHSPLKNMELTFQELEVRTDPLTGQISVLNSGLAGKSQILFPDTDYDYLLQRGEETRQTCFLCPPDWRKNTPAYPEEFLPEGRLEYGQAALFPNLFPIGAYHSVIRLGDKHLRMLNDFPVQLLTDGFKVALEFVRKCQAYDPSMIYATINANYLFPAGASLIHPHFQVISSPTLSTHHQLLLQKSFEYRDKYSSSYWDDLVQKEMNSERFIGRISSSCWLAAFAPMGFNEIQVIWPERQSFLHLTDEDVHDLALGLGHLLDVWHEMKLSTFNFSCFSAPLGRDTPHFCCVMRIVNRQNVIPHHRTDDYFFQKLMRNELILNRPEELARRVRTEFPGGL